MNSHPTSALNLIVEDSEVITYRKSLNKITGSITASILLQQILYRASKNGWKPFYKFKEPCGHERYKETDSWTEELGFTRHEFDGALNKIATKVTSKTKDKVLAEGKTVKTLVVYWTDTSRMTWYQVNLELANRLFEEAYSEPTLRKAENRRYKQADCNDTDKAENRRYVEPESDFSSNSETTTENTSKTTTEEKNISTQKPKSSYSPGFIRFNEIHPWGKENRSKAYKVWQKHKLEPLAAEICEKLAAQLQWQKHTRSGYRYFSRMEAYLNGRRWEDEDTSQPQQQSVHQSNWKVLNVIRKMEEEDRARANGIAS